MANGKKITANLKMRIPGGQASAGPPVGSTLGQYGVNMMDFINPFNEQTKELQGQTVTVHIRIYEDRSMTWRVCVPFPLAWNTMMLPGFARFATRVRICSVERRGSGSPDSMFHWIN